MSLLARLTTELRDPWGLLVGGVSGGMAWAVLAAPIGAAALPVGVAVGAAVLGVKAVSGLLLDRDEESDGGPAPAPGTEGALWLTRAERAVQALRCLAPPPALRPAVARAVGEARDTLAVLRRLGGQVAALEGVLARIDPRGLRAEADVLSAQTARTTSGAVRADLERSAAAVADRLAAHQRLVEARAVLLARMQAVAFGLEGLDTRLQELVALSGAGSGLEDPAAQVAELAADLEGLRAGLVEAEALGRGALAARAPDGPGARTRPRLTD